MPKCYVFILFVTLHMWIDYNPVIWLLLTTCHNIWSLSVRKKWNVYKPFETNVTISCFLTKSEIQNWSKSYHVTILITCHDVWSVSVTKMFNVLPAVFQTYPKILLFYTFCHNTHMNWLKPCHLAMWSLCVRRNGNLM